MERTPECASEFPGQGWVGCGEGEGKSPRRMAPSPRLPPAPAGRMVWSRLWRGWGPTTPFLQAWYIVRGRARPKSAKCPTSVQQAFASSPAQKHRRCQVGSGVSGVKHRNGRSDESRKTQTLSPLVCPSFDRLGPPRTRAKSTSGETRSKAGQIGAKSALQLQSIYIRVCKPAHRSHRRNAPAPPSRNPQRRNAKCNKPG